MLRRASRPSADALVRIRRFVHEEAAASAPAASGANELADADLRLLARQQKREKDAINDATNVYRRIVEKAAQRGDASSMPSVRHLLQRWFAPLDAALSERRRDAAGAGHDTDSNSYGRYLDPIPTDKLAVISLHSILTLLVRGEVQSATFQMPEGKVTTARVSHFIGEAVQAQVNLLSLEARAREMSDQSRTGGARRAAAAIQRLNKVKGVNAANLLAARERVTDAQWDPGQRVKIGGFLLRAVLETASVKVPGQEPGTFEIKPAFELTYVYDPRSERRHGAVKWHPRVGQILREADELRGSLHPRHAPMLVPPRPWTSFDKGGYHILDSLIMRGGYGPAGPSKAQLDALREEQRRGDLNEPGRGFLPVLEALNVLGSTQWKINTRVLKTMERVWAEGGGIADIPPRQNIPLPPPPPSCFALHHSHGMQLLCYGSKPMLHDQREHKQALKKVQQRNRELHSLRCDFELKLNVAKDNRHESALYFPHNVDFRGRAYTMHPHLNHLGADSCRGLLVFAQPQPLGAGGVRWLRIQVANLFGGGIDKKSMAEREQFSVDNMHLISDSALQPLDGQRWWMQAEDAWQCLAACIELHEALQSPDPSAFLSHLPVHQDGSCNGLQHYAALGRDEEGGKAVNLLPGDLPEDVYKGIANLVNEMVIREAPTSREAARLVGHVDRKLVKQTVMTSVYGVTFMGAREQIWNRLKERKAFESGPEGKATAMYAARKVMDALGSMFENAKSVMDWLNECAKIIAYNDKVVSWRTPVGLPVVQPYRKRSKRSVQTVLQTFTVPMANDHSSVNKPKQRTAFPPNYIHSLDSAHMMLTARACHKEGISFAGVHDSYWTHAGTVDDMNRILRDMFVEMHGQPLLQQLHASFKQECPDIEFRAPPPSGSLDLEAVRRSTYFFS